MHEYASNKYHLGHSLISLDVSARTNYEPASTA